MSSQYEPPGVAHDIARLQAAYHQDVPAEEYQDRLQDIIDRADNRYFDFAAAFLEAKLNPDGADSAPEFESAIEHAHGFESQRQDPGYEFPPDLAEQGEAGRGDR